MLNTVNAQNCFECFGDIYLYLRRVPVNMCLVTLSESIRACVINTLFHAYYSVSSDDHAGLNDVVYNTSSLIATQSLSLVILTVKPRDCTALFSIVTKIYLPPIRGRYPHQYTQKAPSSPSSTNIHTPANTNDSILHVPGPGPLVPLGISVSKKKDNPPWSV